MKNFAEHLGVRWPVFNAGMCFVAGPRLASAVTAAGGMGFLGEGLSSPQWLARNYRRARSLCGGGPIGVDFITPFFTQDHVAVVKEIRPAVSVFFYGIPSQKVLEAYRTEGLEFWVVVNSLSEADVAVREGPAALVVQGLEAGGHNRSEKSTRSLLAEICPMAGQSGIHVVAAGGIHDSETVREALLAGASGVWCGTRFLASLEANAHDEYKRRVLEAGPDSTVISHAFGPEWPDEPMRVFRNGAVRAYEGQGEHPDVLQIGQTLHEGQWIPMPRYSCFLPVRETKGDIDLMALTMGVEAASIKTLKSARILVEELAEGYLLAE